MLPYINMLTKPVLGYENYYSVNRNGDIFSEDRKVNYRIKGYTKKWKGRKMKQKTSKRGYKDIVLCLNGKCLTHRVHKIVAEAFMGKRPDGLQIAHLDGNPENNCLKNLQYVTAKENAHHKILHGTVASGQKNGKYTKPKSTPKGEDHWQSKLNWETVNKIRKSKKSSRELAKKYNVTHTNIINVKNYKIWQI